jgi:hypothetical protein
MSGSSVIDRVFSIPETVAATMVISPELRRSVLRDRVLSGAQYFALSRANEVIEQRRSLVEQCQEAAMVVFNTYLDTHTKLSSFYKQLVMLAVADKCGEDKRYMSGNDEVYSSRYLCLDESKDKGTDDWPWGIGPTFTEVEVVARYLEFFDNLEVALPHIVPGAAASGHAAIMGSLTVQELIKYTRVDPFHNAAWDPVWPAKEVIRMALLGIRGSAPKKILNLTKSQLRSAGFLRNTLVWDFYQGQERMNGATFPPILAPDPENARGGVALDGISRGTPPLL